MNSFSSASDDAARSGLRPDLRELVSKLEQSLRAGQQALLVRDLEELEEQTRLQASLSRALAESLSGWTPGENSTRAACSRVVHLCRVQLGLLQRAQRSLRVLSNLLAGAERTYLPGNGTVGSHRAVPHRAVPQKEG